MKHLSYLSYMNSTSGIQFSGEIKFLFIEVFKLTDKEEMMELEYHSLLPKQTNNNLDVEKMKPDWPWIDTCFRQVMKIWGYVFDT